MDTIVIQLNQPEKAKMLMERLRSLDFVASVNSFDKLMKARKLFEEINKIAANTPLQAMNEDDIRSENQRAK